jgi:hypothetical protein
VLILEGPASLEEQTKRAEEGSIATYTVCAFVMLQESLLLNDYVV